MVYKEVLVLVLKVLLVLAARKVYKVYKDLSE
jgi:hypothetical protein